MSEDDVLTVAQVAGILNKDTTHVRKYIKTGDLQATWDGSRYLIRRKDVEDFRRKKDQERR